MAFFFFFLSEGEGSNNFPILRNLNSACTEENNTLNNLNIKTSQLGNGKMVWLKEKSNETKSSEKNISYF